MALVRVSSSLSVIVAANYPIVLSELFEDGEPLDYGLPGVRFRFVGRDAWDPVIADIVKILKVPVQSPQTRIKNYRKRKHMILVSKGLSDDVLKTMCRMKREGVSQRRIAEHFGVSKSFVQRLPDDSDQ